MQTRISNRSIFHKMPGLYPALLLLLLPMFVCLVTACNITGSSNSGTVYEYDFHESEHSWEPFFTDYNAGWEDSMELTADYRHLPEPLDTEKQAHFVSAVNHSDDVKMLYRKQIDGLVPNTTYRTMFTVRFATNVPSGCAGIGGAPGEAVKVIASASDIKPEAVIEQNGNDYYLLNIQHISNSSEWYENAIMGDIANSRECSGEETEYEIKKVTSGPNHDTVTSDENGRAWLMFGTRSGFEGKTALYYTYFKAMFYR